MVTRQMPGKIDDDYLFDDTVGYEDSTGLSIAPNLSEDDRKRATTLARLFSLDRDNVLCGLCLVKGAPGAGKDVFGNYLSYTLKRYFPYKRIFRDERPRRLYGEYVGLFNPDVVNDELDKMDEIAKGKGIVFTGAKKTDDLVDAWVTSRGVVLLKDCVAYLTEFWKYVYKREPHNKMNKTMGGIHKEKRHIGILIIGTVQQLEDLDIYTCMPFVDWTVTCTHSTYNPTGFVYFVQRVKWNPGRQLLDNLGSPFPIAFDAGSPRSYMGDGKIHLLRPDYIYRNDEERIVLDLLKAGLDTYEDLIDTIHKYGDMTTDEILYTLKVLRFGRGRWVIDYPCVFGLFNSRSAPQDKTRAKVED